MSEAVHSITTSATNRANMPKSGQAEDLLLQSLAAEFHAAEAACVMGVHNCHNQIAKDFLKAICLSSAEGIAGAEIQVAALEVLAESSDEDFNVDFYRNRALLSIGAALQKTSGHDRGFWF